MLWRGGTVNSRGYRQRLRQRRGAGWEAEMRDQLRLLRAGAQRAAGGATNPGVTVARSDASGWAAPYPTGFSLFLELPTGLREQGKNDKLTLLSIFVSLRKLC